MTSSELTVLGQLRVRPWIDPAVQDLAEGEFAQRPHRIHRPHRLLRPHRNGTRRPSVRPCVGDLHLAQLDLVAGGQGRGGVGVKWQGRLLHRCTGRLHVCRLFGVILSIVWCCSNILDLYAWTKPCTLLFNQCSLHENEIKLAEIHHRYV